MSDKPTILILVDDLGVGGAQRQLVELLKGLKRDGRFRTALGVFYRGGGLESEAIARADLLLPLRYRIRSAPFALVPFIRQVQRSGARLIHVTFGANSAAVGLLAARRLRLPVINGAIRNALPHLTFGFRLTRWCALRSDVIVANSAAGLAAYGLSQHPRARVIPNGVDLARFANVSAGDAEWSMCMVGNFNEWKDHETIVRAFALVRATFPGARLALVGRDAGTLEANRRLVADLGLSDAVQFITDTSNPGPFIAASQVCVLASPQNEGLSNALLEYMALAKPAVATRVGGNPEVVQDGETGFLVPPQSPEAMARRVEELLRNPERARQMGAAGRRRLVEVFALDRMVGAYEGIYDHLLGRTK